MNGIELEEHIKEIFIISLTHGIYVDDIDKKNKIIKISVPTSSCQNLYGEELASEFKHIFTQIFKDYKVLYKHRNCYWSIEDSERFFDENIDMVLNEIERIIEQGR